MAQTNAGSTTRNLTPQATGFSQIHSRGGGEGGGQAMSVLLSWHEKVQPTFLPRYDRSCPVSFSRTQFRNIPSNFVSAISMSRAFAPLLTHPQLVEIAGPGSIVRVMTDRRTV